MLRPTARVGTAALVSRMLAARGLHSSVYACQRQPPSPQGFSWVSPDAQPKGEALKKYGRVRTSARAGRSRVTCHLTMPLQDLTEAAKKGKLDPVIGT